MSGSLGDHALSELLAAADAARAADGHKPSGPAGAAEAAANLLCELSIAPKKEDKLTNNKNGK